MPYFSRSQCPLHCALLYAFTHAHMSLLGQSFGPARADQRVHACLWSRLASQRGSITQARKKKDFYMWLSRCPDGPSVKFHILNGALGPMLS